ncbi:MAG: UbiH/UbiF/VisC/COQ6 family ubiquinone biosynthesis hydroxylase [Gammaproteobacteria bacterium]|nr:UbiH/UbiF/VisC/COQ6 family ubiquinone biosynthesis hydroxylase [Gammaproteobacteria bacterium]
MQKHITFIGAGITGLTAALAIAQKTDFEILTLDATKTFPIWDPNIIDHRVSAISPGSQRIFEKLKVWNTIASKRISPYLHMHVWDENSQGKIDFTHRECFEETLGHIIENSAIHASLLAHAQKNPQIKIISSCEVTTFIENPTHIEIKTQSHGDFSTELLIAADGANSWARAQFNIPMTQRDYGHTAIVATVTTEQPHAQTAWQRFLTTGPLAFLPLKDACTCSIVWSTQHDAASTLMQLSESDFMCALETAFDKKLGRIVSVSKRYAFPLRMQHAKHYIKNRFALIGDAAHTIHPLLGQGMNQGILDATTLAEVISEAENHRRDFAAHYTLRKYERARKAGNSTLLTAADFFKNIFSHPNPILKSSRAMGMNTLNRISLFKKILADCALGNLK